MPYITIEMPNITEFVNKLKLDAILGKEWADSLRAIIETTEKAAKARAPIGVGPGTHGSIPAAIGYSIDTRPIPTYGKVTLSDLTRASKGGKSFRYAGALQGAPRYHYRAGPRQGKPTRRWFSGAMSRKAIEGLLQAAVDRIEARWQRT